METNTRSNWSFWERSSLLGRPDLVVIGSGIVGLTAAIRLRERFPDRRVVVLERGSLPSGASTRNAGFACFGSMTELLADLEARPEEEVWQLVGRRWQGLQRLRALLGD
ncbi:MAG: FAD-dependent oxidoreductase, partial [Saprospiraceae bacterium]|nr:FAD-dependent oxidoreductase [Saprospiraceae bacterium]